MALVALAVDAAHRDNVAFDRDQDRVGGTEEPLGSLGHLPAVPDVRRGGGVVVDEPAEVLRTELGVLLRVEDEVVPHLIQFVAGRDGGPIVAARTRNFLHSSNRAWAVAMLTPCFAA